MRFWSIWVVANPNMGANSYWFGATWMAKGTREKSEGTPPPKQHQQQQTGYELTLLGN
jgi:hypothetical protein